MIFVKRDRIHEPAIFKSEILKEAMADLQQFYYRPVEERRQERYSYTNPILIKEVKEGLNTLFRGKCAYCECPVPIEKMSIDHFRPRYGARGLENEFSRDHYWWLTYTWENLYYCCEECNNYKSSWFPVSGKRASFDTAYNKIIEKEVPLLIDPCLDEPEEHFSYDEEGYILPESKKAEVTIEILNLNRTELVLKRKQSRKAVFARLEEYRNDPSLYLHELRIHYERAKSSSYGAIQRFFLLSAIRNLSEEIESNVLPLPEVKENIHIPFPDLSEPEELWKKEESKETYLKRVFLDKLVLKNFKCFSDLTITFNKKVESDNTNGEISGEPWTLFLGENGAGKTSILKALAIALMGDECRHRQNIAPHITPEKLLKHGAKRGFIKLFLEGEKEPIRIDFRKSSPVLKCLQQAPLPYLLGYGVVRVMPVPHRMIPEKGTGTVKVENLFDYSVALEDANKWLLKIGKKSFDFAAMALKDLLLLDNEDRLERNKVTNQIYVVRRKERFSMDELSDGYRCIYTLAVDIMSRLIREGTTFDLAEGIVLLDEIGTHLHPRWKMQVVENFRKAFPRLQFIVTTHEPLCLRGMRAGETVVLTEVDEEIISDTNLPDPSELRIDQILTSSFFGLRSTFDIKTERLFEEYYSLLAKHPQHLTAEEKSRLAQLNREVPRKKHFGDDLREEALYLVIDELLAKKGRIRDAASISKEAKDQVKEIWESMELEI